MKKITILFLTVFSLFFSTVIASAETSGCYDEQRNGWIAALHDLDGSLSESEESLLFSLICDTVDQVNFSVCVVYSSDIGSPKTDAQVIDYADLYCEALCGMNTDAILLLINNDTKYDWISTSGRCIDIFTDARIERVFDNFYDQLKKGNFYEAGARFCSSVASYGTGKGDSLFSGTLSFSLDIDFFLSLLFFGGFAAVILVIIVESIKKSYSVQAQKGARHYVLQNSLCFDKKSDTFLRSYVTTQSASSGGSRSGHSSTHRSSSGGRHGGGGRHR